jgi:hypothetical protein
VFHQAATLHMRSEQQDDRQFTAGERPLHTRYVRRLRDAPLDAAFRLVEASPIRTATSIGEARAAAYVDGRMRRAGLHVSADTFRAYVPPSWDSALIAALAVCAAVVYFWIPVLALVLALGALGILVGEVVRGVPLLGRTRPSQNVVAVRAASDQQRARVVLLAPLDTPSNTLVARLFGSRRRMQALAAGTLLLQVLFGLVGLVDVQRTWLYLQFVTLSIPLLIVVIDQAVRFEPHSPGAVNHAGALAVLVSACESLEEFEHTEFWAVALGSTADGAGMDDFLRRYPFDAQTTLFIGLESLGAGELTYLVSEGWPQRRHSDLTLADAAGEAALHTEAAARSAHYAGNTTLAGALARRGHRTLTIMCLDAFGHRPLFASALDLPEHLDAGILDRATRLAVMIVHQIEHSLHT